jgi:MFS family permease
VIAVLQLLVHRRLLAGRGRMPMAGAGAGLFAAAWLLALLRRPAVLLMAMGVFGLGETLYVPVMAAMVNDLAPEAQRARWNAVYNLSNQVGPVIGPAVGGAVLAGGHGAALFVGLAVACALAGAAALAIEPLLGRASSAA